MTVASTRHGLSVYTGADDDTEPTPTVGSGHRDEEPRPESGEILDQGGRPVSQDHRIGVSATTAPSTVYLKAFGPDGTVTNENEPHRGGNTNRYRCGLLHSWLPELRLLPADRHPQAPTMKASTAKLHATLERLERGWHRTRRMPEGDAPDRFDCWPPSAPFRKFCGSERAGPG